MNGPSPQLCAELCQGGNLTELAGLVLLAILSAFRELQWRRREYRWSVRPPPEEPPQERAEPPQRDTWPESQTQPQRRGLRRVWTCAVHHEWIGRMSPPPRCPICGSLPLPEEDEPPGPD